MKSFRKYKILKQKKLVIEIYKNDLFFRDAEELKKRIFEDGEFCQGLNFLIDVRKTTYNVTSNQLKKYRDFIISNLEPKAIKKIALLTNKPEQVAHGLLFGYNQSKLLYNYNVFSTLEAAVKWLEIDYIKSENISLEIDKLSNA